MTDEIITEETTEEFTEEVSPISDVTDGEPDTEYSDIVSDTDAQPEIEAYTLSITNYADLAISSIPIGALLGAIFMIVGLAYSGIVKIFKKL